MDADELGTLIVQMRRTRTWILHHPYCAAQRRGCCLPKPSILSTPPDTSTDGTPSK